jgi:prepilin-type N-terminal cleavage/methylation domain-containing protein
MSYKTIKNKGFTLIEVMVVVSIIALMSSVALSSMSSAYSSARNSKRIQMIKQYVTALELYRNDNSSYPQYGDGSTGRLCVGETGSNVCHASTRSGDSNLNSTLNQYIKGTPASLEKVMVAGVDFHGITYSACPSSGCSCPGTGCINGGYQLEWYLEGSANNCGAGSKWTSGAMTRCTYP